MAPLLLSGALPGFVLLYCAVYAAYGTALPLVGGLTRLDGEPAR